MTIYEEIQQEREYQNDKWGGQNFDDQHTDKDWLAFVVGYLGRAYSWEYNAAAFRKAMIKVAALAVAAIEWADRKEQVAA